VPSERAFLRQRLALVERWLANPDREFIPAARYLDGDGAPWIIDDRFLVLLDDLVGRLQKWFDEE